MYLKTKKSDDENNEYWSDNEMFEYIIIKNALREPSKILKNQRKTNKS